MIGITLKTSKEKISKERTSNKICRKINVERKNVDRKKSKERNVDHMICRKLRDVIIDQHWFSFRLFSSCFSFVFYFIVSLISWSFSSNNHYMSEHSRTLLNRECSEHKETKENRGIALPLYIYRFLFDEQTYISSFLLTDSSIVECPTTQVVYHLLIRTRVAFNWFLMVSFSNWIRKHQQKITGNV